MFDDPVRLERLQVEIELRRAALAEHRAQIARLQKEMSVFANEYDRVVGRLQDQLDAVCQQIEALQAPPPPANPWGARFESLEEQFEARYRKNADMPQPSRKNVDDATLRTLYRRLARRYHPDTTTDPEEKARLTVIMARINAAYRAKNADELYALDKSPGSAYSPPSAPLPKFDVRPTLSDLLRQMNQLDDQITDAKIEYQNLMNSPLMILKIECSLARGRRRDLLSEMAQKVRADLDAAQVQLAGLRRGR